jgi:hypothetical protein
MADLSEIQSAQAVKVVGSDGTGVEQTPVRSTSGGGIHVNNRDSSGTEIITHGTNNVSLPTQSVLVAGSDGIAIRPLATDNEGRLVTSALTGFGADFTFGRVATAAITKVFVRATTYNEPTAQAQRSISSSSANDSSAGTGARTILIKYLNNAGIFLTETITLNGTTPVNTVATDIRYIEQIDVLTVGSGGTNAGTITLFVGTGGTGGTIGTIAVGDKQTFWAHHYVQAGKICNITGLSCSHNGTVVGSGAVFTIEAQDLVTANAASVQVSDFVRLYGQSSTFSRIYTSPIKISGLARVVVYVTPEATSAITYRAAFDFFEP